MRDRGALLHRAERTDIGETVLAATQKAEQLLTGTLLLLLVVAFGYFVLHSVAAIRFPFPLDYGEGPLLNQAKLLAAGRNIYRPDLTDYPYTVANYPPVYVTMLALASRVLGLSYAIGRAITMTAALMSATFIVLILHALTDDRMASAVGGMLFFAFPYVIYWSSLARVDLVALAFSLAGILVIARWPYERGSPFVSALLMMGAVFTRQSYLLAAPLAVAGWLFLQSPRKAATFVLSLTTGTLVLFGFLNALTQGGIFFHTVIANANYFSPSRLARYLLHFLLSSAPLLVIVLAELGSSTRRRQNTSVLPLLYLLGGFLSTLTIGKVGSEVNYFLELVAALCLVTGVAVARWRQSSRTPWVRPILFALLALQTVWLLRLSRLHTHPTTLRFQMQPEFETLQDLVQEEPGPILADEYMSLLVVNERELLLQPFEFTRLADEGKWDQSRLIADIRARRFGLILISDQPPVFSETLARSRWTPEMWGAIQEAYEPVRILAGTTLYRPPSSLPTTLLRQQELYQRVDLFLR